MSAPLIHPRNKRLWEQTGGHCVYCDRLIQEGQRTTDHVWPDSKGGTKHLKNTVPACGPCNRRRAIHWPPSDKAHPRWKEYVREKEEGEYVQGLKARSRPRVRKTTAPPPGVDPIAWRAEYLAEKVDAERARQIAEYEDRKRREGEHWKQRREEARLERVRKKQEQRAAARAPLAHQPFADLPEMTFAKAAPVR